MTRPPQNATQVRLRGPNDWRHLSHTWLLVGMAGTPVVVGLVYALLQR